MLEASLARNGYQNSIKSTSTDREIEYQVFARITNRLSFADKKAPDYHRKINEALHDNLRLWAVLASDVAGDGNKLPAKLRSGLFYLAEFTRHHTAKIFAGEADPSVLVDINKSVMRGLRGNGENKREDT